jgi:hypothetical protein
MRPINKKIVHFVIIAETVTFRSELVGVRLYATRQKETRPMRVFGTERAVRPNRGAI